MNVLIVYAHPNPASFNHAMLESLISGLKQAGHDIHVKDLYAEKFDPVLKVEDLEALQAGQIPSHIEAEQKILCWADSLMFLYPLWWFDRPAILKGWFDVVFTNQVAFTFDSEGVQGLLKHKKALVMITAGGAEDYFKDTDAMHLIHRPVTDGTLGFCGISDVQHKIYFDVLGLSADEREDILNELVVVGKNF